jgi:hypothetical protein
VRFLVAKIGTFASLCRVNCQLWWIQYIWWRHQKKSPAMTHLFVLGKSSLGNGQMLSLYTACAKNLVLRWSPMQGEESTQKHNGHDFKINQTIPYCIWTWEGCPTYCVRTVCDCGMKTWWLLWRLSVEDSVGWNKRSCTGNESVDCFMSYVSLLDISKYQYNRVPVAILYLR